ncbi:hypothetical protein GCM10011531_14110 [Aquaticitalea lipolytica]|uniref:Uncharacterized protein n=1 Tax=Aquaticitalea lipolytica TaxID=1247562 RepID=A0A8J2XGL8_9FLAO|nr:hypothetical protein [Aquaticitalea lipolytica]GFZ84535.1 hypothetical protein GCM10011531_14110 [Aquaticitalea lipolytica]
MSKIDKKEILVSSAKSIFGVIPFAGTALNELFFEYNGSIKQKRLNNFIDILSEYFAKNSDVKIENIKTEDFNDIFESVLRRVVQTKSELKLIRFKDILITQLNNPIQEIELVELYLDLISSLSEEEISILHGHRNFDLNYEEEINNLNKLRDELNQITEKQKRETIIINQSRYHDDEVRVKSGIEEIEDKIEPLKKLRTSEYYELSYQKFEFYKQRLFSKGLLVDNRMNRNGSFAFQNMGITEFGLEFLDFIINSEK